MRFDSLTQEPKVLLGGCSDDRLPFLAFVEQELMLPEGFYFPLRLAGGLSPLAHKNEVPDDFKSTLKAVKFPMDHRPSITTGIILEHAFCGYRQECLPSDLVHNGIEDLDIIADVLFGNFPQFTQIQLWFADLINGGKTWDFSKIKVVESQQVCRI